MCISCNLGIVGESVKELDPITPSIEESDGLFKGDAPAFINASRATSSSAISVSWASVPGADYYKLFRAKVGDDGSVGEFTEINESIFSTNYEDTANLSFGVKYAYKVHALSLADTLESGDSKLAYGTLLATPTFSSVSQGKLIGAITLEWLPVLDVESYQIQKTTYSGGVPSSSEVPTLIPSAGTAALSYRYEVESAEEGEEIHFRIRAIKNGKYSPYSISKIGYSKVLGAPEAPTGFTASKGEALSGSFTISWDYVPSGTSDEYKYEVYRSADGMTDVCVLTSEQSEALTADAKISGKYSFVDKKNISAIKAGVRYTYSVKSIGKATVNGEVKEISSPSSETDAYLFSPTAFEAVTSSSEGGAHFNLRFTQVVGLDTASDLALHLTSWKYKVTMANDDRTITASRFVNAYGETIDGTQSNTGTLSKLVSITVPYEAATAYTRFAVSVVKDDGMETASCDEYHYEGVKAITLSATANAYYSSFKTLSNGLYPVRLTLTDNDGKALENVASLKILRYAGEDTTSTPTVVESAYTASSALYDDESLLHVGQKYTYTVQATDGLGKTYGVSNSATGYGGISGPEYVYMMQRDVLKPWEYPIAHPEYVSGSKSAIWGYIKNAGMSSLGSASASDDHGGTISYNATVEGLGGAVKFSYDNYGEVYDGYRCLVGTGYYTMHVDMSGTGTIESASSVTITGMYPSTIGFGSVSVNSQKLKGKYSINQTHSTGNKTYKEAPVEER